MSIASDPIAGPSAWRRCDVRSEDYRIELSSACLDEIRRAADELRGYPLPTIVLGPDGRSRKSARRRRPRSIGCCRA
jgi:hypothetical protein